MKYASIIISISHSDIDRIFHYKIPENLKDKISLGTRVIVPFGKGNKSIEGYVVGFSEVADVDEKYIKPILNVCEDYSLISEKRIELAMWMREKYYTTLSSCIQCIIPKVVKDKKFALVTLEDEVDENEVAKILKKDTKIKRILEFILECKVIPSSHLKFLFGESSYGINTLVKKGICKVVYEKIYRGSIDKNENFTKEKPTLNEEQKKACDFIFSQMESEKKKPILINGVTGSGKTEVYIRVIEKVIEKGQAAIVLVPEISLTAQTVDRFVSRFGSKVSFTHSKLSDGERFDQWLRARNGDISVMIGARSAIFTPFENLGVIIIDEEHESTYKSDQLSPKYDAREVAEKLASLYGCSVILGSATPSINSYFKAQKGEYELCVLKNRVNNLFPSIEIIDMRQELANRNFSIFSRKLKNEIDENIKNGEQTILFLNKRGYSSFVSCRECGYVMVCDNCDVSYTYHKGINSLSCHYCGKQVAVPNICPKCKSKYIKYFGTGTEKVEQEVIKAFPEARVLRMDVDTTQRKGSHQKIYEEFKAGNADILIGTQMIAKGLDFENVTLVGVLAADISLHFGDYRASEVTYQLISQVCGRAGRGKKQGRALVQTYSPDEYSLKYAQKNDYEGFYEEEILFRQNMVYPPFTNIFVIVLSSSSEWFVKDVSQKLMMILRHYNKDNIFGLLGPCACAISKINNKYRWQIIIKCEDEVKLRKYSLYCVEKLKGKIDLKDISFQLSLNPNFI